MAESLRFVRAASGSFQPRGKALAWQIGYLCGTGVAPAVLIGSQELPLEVLVDRCSRYRLAERGLVEGTVSNYLDTVKLFRATTFSDVGREIEDVTVANVVDRATERCPRRSVGLNTYEATSRPPCGVADARDQEYSWAEITDLLGVTRASAWQRFGGRTRATAHRSRTERWSLRDHEVGPFLMSPVGSNSLDVTVR